jgi:hypothetical protein
MKTKRVEGYEDHRALGLKPGDIAWFYPGRGSWDYPEKIRITGPCADEIGHGYSAQVLEPEPTELWKKQGIHTCNGFLCKSKAAVRREFHRSLSESAKKLEENIRISRQNLRWMEWVLAGNGF